MKQAVSTERNKMGTVPVRRLLLGMGAPMIVSIPSSDSLYPAGWMRCSFTDTPGQSWIPVSAFCVPGSG